MSAISSNYHQHHNYPLSSEKEEEEIMVIEPETDALLSTTTTTSNMIPPPAYYVSASAPPMCFNHYSTSSSSSSSSPSSLSVTTPTSCSTASRTRASSSLDFNSYENAKRPTMMMGTGEENPVLLNRENTFTRCRSNAPERSYVEMMNLEDQMASNIHEQRLLILLNQNNIIERRNRQRVYLGIFCGGVTAILCFCITVVSICLIIIAATLSRGPGPGHGGRGPPKPHRPHRPSSLSSHHKLQLLSSSTQTLRYDFLTESPTRRITRLRFSGYGYVKFIPYSKQNPQQAPSEMTVVTINTLSARAERKDGGVLNTKLETPVMRVDPRESNVLLILQSPQVEHHLQIIVHLPSDLYTRDIDLEVDFNISDRDLSDLVFKSIESSSTRYKLCVSGGT